MIASPTFAAVLRVVSADAELPAARIVGRTRDAWTSRARWVCWWLLRERGMSLHEIGRLFGRHHTSVLHGLRQTEWMRANDPLLAARLADLSRAVRREMAGETADRDGWSVSLGRVSFAPLVGNLVGCVSRETGAAA